MKRDGEGASPVQGEGDRRTAVEGCVLVESPQSADADSSPCVLKGSLLVSADFPLASVGKFERTPAPPVVLGLCPKMKYPP